jgi:hypothetical protein
LRAAIEQTHSAGVLEQQHIGPAQQHAIQLDSLLGALISGLHSIVIVIICIFVIIVVVNNNAIIVVVCGSASCFTHQLFAISTRIVVRTRRKCSREHGNAEELGNRMHVLDLLRLSLLLALHGVQSLHTLAICWREQRCALVINIRQICERVGKQKVSAPLVKRIRLKHAKRFRCRRRRLLFEEKFRLRRLFGASHDTVDELGSTFLTTFLLLSCLCLSLCFFSTSLCFFSMSLCFFSMSLRFNCRLLSSCHCC